MSVCAGDGARAAAVCGGIEIDFAPVGHGSVAIAITRATAGERARATSALGGSVIVRPADVSAPVAVGGVAQ